MSDEALHTAAEAVTRCWKILYPQLAFALGDRDDFVAVATAMRRLAAALPPADTRSRQQVVADKLRGIDSAPPWLSRRTILDGEPTQ